MSRCLWGLELWVHDSNHHSLRKLQKVVDTALKKCANLEVNATEA